MRQSKYLVKTLKEAPSDEQSINAQLLTRAGYVDKLMAGVYTYLPLGLKVLNNIKDIVRQEMEAVGGQEILLPALHPKGIWQETGRWEEMKNIMFQFKGRGGLDCCLGTTHEEPIVDMLRKRLQSYKDLPVALFQIQDKFRNEPRAKSGLLRGREFSMKDLYSFHANEKDLQQYYDKVLQAYLNIFKRLELEVLVVEASGGSFSKDFSHEFQVLTPHGEDTVYYCDFGKPDSDQSTWWAQNKEIAKVKKGSPCPADKNYKVSEGKAIEVGNIFKLGQKYSEAMNLNFTNQEGEQQFPYMGCYGLGPSRVMGTVVEVHNDKDGIIWPSSIAPFAVHLVLLGDDDDLVKQADDYYQKLNKAGFTVLYDDRKESSGKKLIDAALIGLPHRLVVSKKNKELVEWEQRKSKAVKKLTIEDFIKLNK